MKKKQNKSNLTRWQQERLARYAENRESICRELWFWTSYNGIPVPVFKVYR